MDREGMSRPRRENIDPGGQDIDPRGGNTDSAEEMSLKERRLRSNEERSKLYPEITRRDLSLNLRQSSFFII